jgi:hypothetical protein
VTTTSVSRSDVAKSVSGIIPRVLLCPLKTRQQRQGSQSQPPLSPT